MRMILFQILCVSHLLSSTYFVTEPLVRVRVVNTLDTLNAHVQGDWKLSTHEGDSLFIDDNSQLLFISTGTSIKIIDTNGPVFEKVTSLILSAAEDSATITISDVPFGVGWWWGGVEDRIYEGEINIYMESGKMNTSIHLPLETYLKGVVPYEIGPNSPREALKAQAVAARSEAVIALTSKLYSGARHDLTSDVECQVFSGNERRSPASDQAVEETRGVILSENGAVINAFYSSNCGGRAELIENVWPVRDKAESYLLAAYDNDNNKGPDLSKNWRAKRWIRSSPKVYCNPNYENSLPSWSQTNFRWTREFSVEEISRMITTDAHLGNLKRIKVLKRGLSGRIIKARFIFNNGSFEREGELVIRQLFSPSLRSANFYVKKTRKGFTLRGAGWGHGVGMCQSGAIARASHGSRFEDILMHYYPRSELLNIYQAKD